MKTIKIFSLLSLSLALAFNSFGQKAKTEAIPVSGNCGMCKAKIEKAAKENGASEASWNADTKVLTIKYKSASVNAAKIQEAVAAAGYDTRDVKASQEAYDKLPGCCKYDRADAGNTKLDCCKEGKCSKEGHEGKDCCSKEPGH